MKTGTLIVMLNSNDPEKAVAERVREYLVSRGRRNVFIGSHTGEPDCYEVFLEMNRQGVDTYCILPLAFAEGRQTIWNIPKHLTLPDNSGSWMMIGEHDVATRFSTALGSNPLIGEAIGRGLGEPSRDVGVIVATYGSELSQAEKSAEYYAEYLRYLGWNVRTAFTRFGPRTLKDAEDELRSEGCSSTRVVPLAITRMGGSLMEALDGLTMPYELGKPLSEYDEFYQVLDSKVPEGW